MRFHALTDNTGNYLKGANDYPYGKPAKIEDDDIPMSWNGDIGWADVPDKFIKLDEEEAAKCFCCNGWFPWDSAPFHPSARPWVGSHPERTRGRVL